MPPSEKVHVWSLSSSPSTHLFNPPLEARRLREERLTAGNRILDDGAFVNLPRVVVLPVPSPVLLAERRANRRVPAADADPRGADAATVVETASERTSIHHALTGSCSPNAPSRALQVAEVGTRRFPVRPPGSAGTGILSPAHNLRGSRARPHGLKCLFAGEGGEGTLNGLFPGPVPHLTTHTERHSSPTAARDSTRGSGGKSRGVFHGKIIVRPDAQKTDAMQTNKNLLLSKEALVNSTPALEIRADDVKCRHGSTIGQLDQGALFYLRSRGIGEEEARSLLTYASPQTWPPDQVPVDPRGFEAFLGCAAPIRGAADRAVPIPRIAPVPPFDGRLRGTSLSSREGPRQAWCHLADRPRRRTRLRDRNGEGI